MTIPSISKRPSAAQPLGAACRWAGAGLAYFSMLGASIAAAATLVIDDVPVLLLGI